MKKNRAFFLTLFALIALASAKAASAEDFLCNLTLTASPEVPGLTPAPHLAAEVCGTCSQDVCDNKNVGATCYKASESVFGWCGYVGTCGASRPICQCFGPDDPEEP